MKRIVTVLLGIALMLTMAVAMTGCGKKDAQTAENTAPQVTSTQKADEAKKAEEAKKKEEAKKRRRKRPRRRRKPRRRQKRLRRQRKPRRHLRANSRRTP